MLTCKHDNLWPLVVRREIDLLSILVVVALWLLPALPFILPARAQIARRIASMGCGSISGTCLYGAA